MFTSKIVGEFGEDYTAAYLRERWRVEVRKTPCNCPGHDLIAGPATKIEAKARSCGRDTFFRYKTTAPFDYLSMVILWPGTLEVIGHYIVPRAVCDGCFRLRARGWGKHLFYERDVIDVFRGDLFSEFDAL